MNTSELGSKIKAYRLEKKLTQQQLADLMNVSNKAISKWENSEGLPDLENLVRLAEIFNVKIDTLLSHDIEEASRPIRDWVAIALALSPFILYTLPIYQTGDSIYFSGYYLLGFTFNYITFSFFLIGTSLMLLLLYTVILALMIFKDGLIKVKENNVLTFGGVALSLLMVLASYYASLTLDLPQTGTALVYVGLFILITVLIKTTKAKGSTQKSILKRRTSIKP